MTRNEMLAHEEARLLAAEAVDMPLPADEAAWLDRHLAACADCAAIADEYRAIHSELSALAMPEPPRDLWARTQAALDKVDTAGRGRRSSASMSRTSLLGSSLAVLMVVLLAGASLISQTPLAHPALATGSSAPIAAATTFNGPNSTGSTSQLAVVNGTSYWVSGGNGLYAIMGGTPSCDPADSSCTVTTGGGKTLGTIQSQTSVSAAIAPDANVAAVWTTDKIAIVPLTDSSKTVSLDQMTPQPTIVVTPAPTLAPTPVPTPVPTPMPTPMQTASPSPTPVPTPTPSAIHSALASATATTSAEASALATATATATATKSEMPKPTSTPTATVAPTSVATTVKPPAGGPIAILSGFEIVGRDPEFSSDGKIVAFSARPSDHSAGPDVFVWQAGDMRARAITTSHSDQFAGWFGTKLLVSEIASGKGTATSSDPVGAISYVFDVTSGTKLRISRPMLMPSVDPTGTYVVYWTGRVQFDPVLGIWQPDGGDLYFDRWSHLTLVSGDTPDATPTPELSAEPAATPTPAATTTSAATSTATAAATTMEASPSAPSSATPAVSALPSALASATPALTPAPSLAPTAAPSSLPQRLPVVSDAGVVKSWQVRWDAPGRHIAAWVADKGSAKVGRLSLFSVNDEQDLVDTDQPLLNAERVMPTIQFDSSHLVWTSAVDGNTYLQAVPALPPSSVSTSSRPPATAPLTTDRPGA